MESKATPRTDEQIIGKLPIEVQLGDKVYKIKPLTILKGMEWRKRLHTEVSGILETFNHPVSSGLNAGLATALLQFPEKLTELLFAYAPDDLPREEIMETATEEQIALAFSKLIQVAYPFLAHLGTLSTAMKAVAVGQVR